MVDVKRQDITLQDRTKGISADEFAWGSYFYSDAISSVYNSKGFELWYNLGKIKNTVIDTLGLSRYLESHERYHNLATLVKRYNIEWDENKHHRADYDSEGTALIFYKMLKKLELNDINSLKDLTKYRAIVLKYNSLI